MRPGRFRRVALAPLLVVGLTALSRPAFADPPTLADVEQAYAEIDFERALETSSEALRSGGHPPDETARLYTLLGLSGAALGREDVSRRAFVRALLCEPTLKLDHDLSPKIRAPYLEARGLWASATAERGLKATLRADGDLSVVTVFDPMNVVHTVELSTKPPGPGTTRTRSYARKQEQRLETGLVAEYTLRLLDEFGNALFEVQGTPSLAAAPPAFAAPAPAEPPNRTPYYVTATALGVLGLGAVGAGVAFQLERERAAEEWNGASCEQPGATRAEQCADVDDRRRSAELYAMGFYAAGGTLLAASVVTLALTPSGSSAGSERSAAVSLGLGPRSLAVRGRF